MADEIVQYSRQAPFIEERAEQLLASVMGVPLAPGEELPETPGKLDLLDYDFLHPRNLLFGTPDYVAEKIHELQTELGLEHLQVWSNFPGVPHEQVMKSVKMFSEKVMPQFTGA